MDAVFFNSQPDFRKWLERHHTSAGKLWVGFYKKKSGLASITWPESVDEALCFGWIDGIRKSIDEMSYKIRFMPRKGEQHLEQHQHQARPGTQRNGTHAACWT